MVLWKKKKSTQTTVQCEFCQTNKLRKVGHRGGKCPYARAENKRKELPQFTPPPHLQNDSSTSAGVIDAYGVVAESMKNVEVAKETQELAQVRVKQMRKSGTYITPRNISESLQRQGISEKEATAAAYRLSINWDAEIKKQITGYLRSSNMGPKLLEEQLKWAGHSGKSASSFIKKLDVSWTARAEEATKAYFEILTKKSIVSFSGPNYLRKHLTDYHGYSNDDVELALNKLGFDWSALAKRYVEESYVNSRYFATKWEVKKQMRREGFSEEDIDGAFKTVPKKSGKR